MKAKQWMINKYPENAEFYRHGGASSIFEDMEEYYKDESKALKEEVEKIEEMLMTLKSDHLELVANRGDASEVVEHWEEVLNLITNLEDNG